MRTPREDAFLDDLTPEHHTIAKRWLDYEGGTMAVAALALELHDMRTEMLNFSEALNRRWWRTPAQFIGVSVAAALAFFMSWKGIK